MGVKAAALISLSFWTPFLYIGAIVPGASPWAGIANTVPHIASYTFYPNIAVAVLFQILTLAAWRRATRSLSDLPDSSERGTRRS